MHGPESCIVPMAKGCDAALVVGTDPLSTMPIGTARALAKIPLIVIDSQRSITTDAAKVVIPSAFPGMEAGGTAIRMDGMKIAFEPIIKSKRPSDEQILVRILEAI
jgi:formylmethanofuran dehydrogenase subunit B